MGRAGGEVEVDVDVAKEGGVYVLCLATCSRHVSCEGTSLHLPHGEMEMSTLPSQQYRLMDLLFFFLINNYTLFF